MRKEELETMQQTDRVLFMLASGYVYTGYDTLVKPAAGVQFIQLLPVKLAERADTVQYIISTDSVVAVDSYGRHLHDPLPIDRSDNS